MQMIQEDDGFFFGLGAFETIAVEQGEAQLFAEHLARLEQSLKFFFPERMQSSGGRLLDEIREKSEEALSAPAMREGRKVLKITVSEKNVLVTARENHYTAENYRAGFTAGWSSVRRNETSPLTYHKTLNYGDCILEKRAAAKNGFDEPVFLNTGGELAEGATTNLFFVRNDTVFTPPVSCGMLPGIMRACVMERIGAQEIIIRPEDLASFDGMFVTNSLLGIMPVTRLGDRSFSSIEICRRLSEKAGLYHG